MDNVPGIEWRLAEVTPGTRTKPLVPRKYEIEPLWQQAGSAAADIPTTLVQRGHTYRVRARLKNDTGRASHWSEPVEFMTQ